MSKIVHNKKVQKIITVMAVVFISIAFTIPAAADDVVWVGRSSEIAKLTEVSTDIKDFFRNILFGILVWLCKLIDMFDNTVNTLVRFNLYDLIGNALNITSQMYSIAWSVASIALIIAAIMLMIRADKVRMSDFFKSILTSVLLIIALPSLVSSLSDLRSERIANELSSTFVTYTDAQSDTTITQRETLGTKILANFVYEVDKSLQSSPDEVINYSQNAAFANNPFSVYDLNINEVLDKDVYSQVIASEKPRGVINYNQVAYSDIDLRGKIMLLDNAFGYTGSSNAALAIYDTWQNRKDTYVEYIDGYIYAKVNGAIISLREDNNSFVWLRWRGSSALSPDVNGCNGDMLLIRGISVDSQVFPTETVYVDMNRASDNIPNLSNMVIPYRAGWVRIDETNYMHFGYRTADEAKEDLRWGTYWQYQGYFVYNYERLVIDRIMSYFTPNNAMYFPAEYSELFTYQFMSEIRQNATSLDNAIRLIENKKIYLSQYRNSYSILEYCNLMENYDRREEAIQTQSGSVTYFRALEDHSNEWSSDVKNLSPFYTVTEQIYRYNFSFKWAAFASVLTAVALFFCAFKLGNLLFDVFYVQLIAPIVIATDLQGSGRAKMIIQNLITTNICFLVVIFNMKLYLKVLTVIQQQSYSIMTCAVLTLAGAKFVIDGPDVIVKLLGVDAGVKSGAATLMGMRSAVSMVTGAGRTVTNTVKNVADTPKRFAGKLGEAKAAVEDIKSAEGVVNKVKAIGANTGAGQAFRNAEMQRDNTNEAYASRKENIHKDSNGNEMRRSDPTVPAGGGGGSSSGSAPADGENSSNTANTEKANTAANNGKAVPSGKGMPIAQTDNSTSGTANAPTANSGSGVQVPPAAGSGGGQAQMPEYHGRYGPSKEKEWLHKVASGIGFGRNVSVSTAGRMMGDKVVTTARSVGNYFKDGWQQVRDAYDGGAAAGQDIMARYSKAPNQANPFSSIQPAGGGNQPVSTTQTTNSGSINVNASATSKVELSKNENVQNAAQQAAHQAMNNAVLQAQTTVSQTVNNTENSTNVSNVTNTSGGVNNQTSVTNVNNGTAIPPAVHATNAPIIIQGVDGKDGRDGREGQRGKDGRNGQDGKDGKDGLDSTNIALPPDNNDNQ